VSARTISLGLGSVLVWVRCLGSVPGLGLGSRGLESRSVCVLLSADCSVAAQPGPADGFDLSRRVPAELSADFLERIAMNPMPFSELSRLVKALQATLPAQIFGAGALSLLLAFAGCSESGSSDPEQGGGKGGMQNSGGTEGGGSGGGSAGTSAVGGAGGSSGAAGSGMGGRPSPQGGVGGTAEGSGGQGGNPPASDCDQKVCEDFEAMDKGPVPRGEWTTIIGGDEPEGVSLVVDDTRANSGTKSVKISVPGVDGAIAWLSRKDQEILGAEGGFYARMMFYLPETPTGGNALHFAFMQLSGFHRFGGNQGLLLHSIGGNPGRMRNLLLWPYNPLQMKLMDCFNDSGTQMPTGRWACLEWHVDAENDSIDVWLDGEQQAGNTWQTRPDGGRCVDDQLEGKWEVPKVQLLRFGWQHYHQINATTVWMDDLAMDNERIGCPQ